MKKIENGWGKWELVLLLIGGVAVLVVMIATTADVIARNLLSSSILGTTDLVSLMLLPSFTCALPYIQARKGQIILEFATEKAPAAIKKWLNIFGMAVGVFLFSSIISKCYGMMLQSYAKGDITSGIVNYPIWPFRLILAIVVTSTLVRLALDIIITAITPTVGEPKTEEAA